MRMTWTGLHLENPANTNSFIDNQIALNSSINQHKSSHIWAHSMDLDLCLDGSLYSWILTYNDNV